MAKLQAVKAKDWMCVEAWFCQIWLHILIPTQYSFCIAMGLSIKLLWTYIELRS